MQSKAATVDEYLQTVPPERLPALSRLRDLIRNTLPGYDESMMYGMPAYSKNGQGVAFNSQKNYISIYIPEEVVDRHRDQIKDCGKTCIRYRKPEQIDFELVEKLLRATASSSAEI